jgi:hypothetical protein
MPDLSRRTLTPLLLCALAACGRGETVLSGTLAEGEEITHVWVLGGAERALVEADSFRVDAGREEALELRFAREEREVGRMELRGLPRGATLALRGVSVDDGLAFPRALEGGRAHRVEINGVRFATAAALPDRVDEPTTLLSRSRSGDALLVRPGGDRLPDLRVVVTPGTEIRTPDGDPASLERTDFGDTLRVTGVVENGFVIASQVVIPRRRAADVRAEAEPARPGSMATAQPATGSDGGGAAASRGQEATARPTSDRAGRDAERELERLQERAREEAERLQRELERELERARPGRGNAPPGRGRGRDG